MLGGTGSVTVKGPDGEKTLQISGPPKSYVVHQSDTSGAGTLELRPTPGVQLYSFTFG